MILRARVVLPVSQPPIENGAVSVSGNRVRSLGPWPQFAAKLKATTIDLGDVILLPGLINAHCHLDYTGMAGLVPPQKSFADWIKLITATKAEWNYSEYAESWLTGTRMLLRNGTTTVADFEAVPELLPEVWSSTPLRVVSFLELTGVRSRRDPKAILQEAVTHIESLPAGRSQAALAPHAPYSTVPALLRLAAITARRRKWPLSIHLAESAQEFEMFMRGRGDLFDWLQRNQRDMTDCGLGSPVRQLERSGALARRLLAVHVNYLARHDAALLARKNISVVHCPRSHAYFQHAPFPLGALTRAGVNVCLGTDSLATVYRTRKSAVELSVFEEMHSFAEAHPRFSPKKILEMATVNAARALGLAGKAGQIAPRAWADLIAIPFQGRAANACDAVVHHRGPVSASMIDGAWTIPPKFAATP